jgi:ABC-type multidrug transport system fused ATPase/permease subunit
MALVGQEPRLFSGSIRENIAYGLSDVPMEKVEQAAMLANAAKFITGLPDVSNSTGFF